MRQARTAAVPRMAVFLPAERGTTATFVAREGGGVAGGKSAAEAQVHKAAQRTPRGPAPPPLRSDLRRIRLAFVPATVRPEQFYGSLLSTHKKRGEVALMCAVLDDALTCFQQQLVRRGQRPQRLAREAEKWFFSDDTHWPFSFVNICVALGLEPEYIRRGLKQWTHRRPAEPPPRRQRSVISPRQPLTIAT
jgi:hypothetical protein